MTIAVKFYSAGGSASGIELDALGGAWDHVSMYQAGGFDKPIALGEAQDITWITNSAGEARKGGTAASGQMNNTKWVSSTEVSINGASTESLPITESGHATVRIEISDTGVFSVSGVKLYAYDGTDIANGPSGIWVLAAEVIPPALAGTGDSEWALIDESNYNYLVDRTTDVGYASGTSYNYYVMLSARPKLTQASGLQTFGLAINFDYS
jgi:hypothetical protein